MRTSFRFAITKTLLSTVVLAIAATAAVATPQPSIQLPNDTVLLQGPNGIPMVMSPGSTSRSPLHAGRVKLPRGADVEDDIASNPQAPFINWAGYLVEEGSALGYRFTSGKTAVAKEIEIALAAYDSTNYGYTAQVELYTDDNGAPGTMIDGADATAAETSLNFCCLVTSVKLSRKATLYAGTAYWVIVASDKGSYVAWQFEDTDFVDSQTVGANDGSGWQTSTSQWYVPAVEVK